MICSRGFERQAGDRFGLRVVGTQNAMAVTVVVLVASGGVSHELGRFGQHDLEAGVSWDLAPASTYTILMQVQSQVPGQDADVQVEIPIGNGVSECSRMSGGIIGSWTVVVF